jgi:hypothetical protein
MAKETRIRDTVSTKDSWNNCKRLYCTKFWKFKYKNRSDIHLDFA